MKREILRNPCVDAPEFQELLKLLTKRESEYWDMIRPNSGVLNLIGKPGLFKTAILRSIAKKLNLLYIDHRLTTMDETDLGCFPKTKQRGDFELIYYPIPEWAFDAEDSIKSSYNGCLMCFEELNRANSFLRNAALKILLEKEIGVKFRFSPHVYMCATGNLGEEDNTDVEIFDTALSTRVITHEHNPGLLEWIDAFAKDNVHKDIVYFLSNNPAFYYPPLTQNGNTKGITNPRTWTFLSDFIISTFGEDSTYYDYSQRLEIYGQDYINTSDIIEFLRFTKDHYQVSYKDVLNNKNGILRRENFNKLDRDIVLRLMNDIKDLNILELTSKETDNLIKFLKFAEKDSLVSFLFEMSADFKYDNADFLETADNNIMKILNAFQAEKQIIYGKVISSNEGKEA
jgi:hypothetical protein